jgi:hypothetical protein
MAPNVTPPGNAPIIVVAPAHRCGTTLLQRALNSTGVVLIYGENFQFVDNYPKILREITNNLPTRRSRTREIRERVLGGHYDVDASAMYPDYDGYVRLMVANFYRLSRFYDAQSHRHGRSMWGIKHQIFSLQGFSFFVRLLPQARYIFLYRNVFDVARSGKARFPQSYRSVENYAALGRNWSQNTQFMRSRSGNNFLHLEFAEVMDRPDEVIDRIEAHCGITGIDPAVFRHRINVSPVLDQLTEAEQQTSYRQPVALTQAELSALLPEAEAACRRFGYPLPQVSA